MADDTDHRPTPPTKRRRWTGWTALAGTLALVAAASFTAGRATAPDVIASCEDIRAVYEDYKDAAMEKGDELDQMNSRTDRDRMNEVRLEGRRSFSNAFNAVLQNPDCFTAAASAEAQTWLDEFDKAAP